MKEKLSENRLNEPFENKRELKKRIKSVWKDIAFSLPEIRRAMKQFAGRLKAVKEREGQCYQNDLWLRFIRTLILFLV